MCIWCVFHVCLIVAYLPSHIVLYILCGTNIVHQNCQLQENVGGVRAVLTSDMIL